MRNSSRFAGIALTLLAGAAAAQDRGLLAPAQGLGGAFWQARFERDGSALASVTSLLPPSTAVQTLRLLGDYQFSSLRLGTTGGLRLTGGLLINLRGAGAGAGSQDSAGALPYAGIGYASGRLRGDWDFSADLGLAAQGLGPARLDRLLGSGQGIDAPTRLLPVVRLGMSLAF